MADAVRHVRHPRLAGPLSLALVGFVFALDLLWSVAASSTAPTEFALVDEPAHLATGALFVLALLTLVRSRRPTLSFVAAALVASVAIDLDHVPGLLGWHVLTQGTPRPYTHSLVTPVVLIAAGALVGGRAKPIAFGAAFGVCAHLLRDLCTGPGLALAWPLSGTAVRLPYLVFAAALILTTAAVVAATGLKPVRSGRRRTGRSWPRPSRLLPCLLAAVLVAAGAVAPARAPASQSALGAYIPGADQRPGLFNSFAQRSGGSRPSSAPTSAGPRP
jgi:inner membrane protein